MPAARRSPKDNRHIFISHSSQDAAVASKVCRALESAGIDTWICSRDIQPGQTWASAIADGLEGAGALVLLSTESANHSNHVLREVDLAVKHKVPILPVRLDETPLSKDIKYYINVAHWVSATDGRIDPHLRKIAESCRQLLDQSHPRLHKRLPSSGLGEFNNKQSRLVLPLVAAILAACVVGAGRWSANFGGITKADITHFNNALDDYFQHLQRSNINEVSMLPHDPLAATDDGLTAETLADTDLKRQTVKDAANTMTYNNRSKAEALFELKARVFNKGFLTDKEMAQAVLADRKEWEMRNIPAGILFMTLEIMAVSAITFVVFWLFARVLDYPWRFILTPVRGLLNVVRQL